MLDRARARLLAERTDAGHWVGELSSSPLSTATATCALTLVVRARPDATLDRLVAGGLDWLRAHRNDDGGYGDAARCPSNVSTTALAWATLAMHGDDDAAAPEAWLRERVGGLDARSLARAIGERYGVDRTFSVPILTMCALAGRFGDGPDAWAAIPRLPFELAALPRATFHAIGLPVVSYALPALIAIGQVQHARRPSPNPLARLARAATRRRTLAILGAIQPASGGFLEAAPLTSFVAMSLVGAGEVDHPVVARAIAFLRDTVRADGSWPIDTDLATWVTTGAIGALAGSDTLDASAKRTLAEWLLAQQTRGVHPYTRAAPGGWAWTDRTGGVPDADDTPGAMLALDRLRGDDDALDARIDDAAARGAVWLLDLQNRDGGMPTFCRGWGKLPFDRSNPDLTAHVVRAWDAWRDRMPTTLGPRIDRALARASRYLLGARRGDGTWVPLWFGNPWTDDEANPTWGTARVLLAVPSFITRGIDVAAWETARATAVEWLLAAQHDDGGFGGAPGVAPSIEETAAAIDALVDAPHPRARTAIDRAAAWLAHHTHEGTHFPTTPIGLYFAKLWYSERLYPLIHTVSALSRATARDTIRPVGDDVSREGR